MDRIQPILVGGLVFLISALYLRSRRYARMPPGPMSLPIIGSMLSLRGDDVREVMLRMREKYGDVFTISFGGERSVLLASYDAIKEAFVKNSKFFSHRPASNTMIKELMRNRGVLGSSGQVWKDLRKFSHGVFREFGVGKPIFEEKIQEEITHMMEVLKSNLGKPYSLFNLSQMAVSNVVNNVLFGSRYDYEDADFRAYMDNMNRAVQLMGHGGALNSFPFLKYLPGDLVGYEEVRHAVDFQLEGFRKRIEEHKKTHVPGEVKDYIDAFMEEVAKQKDNEHTSFTSDELVYVINDFFAAASETTATTLRWAGVYMLRNPEVQVRVHKEIDEVIGTRTPNMRDRANMPFTEAVILETQRMGDIVPLGAPHATSQDVEFRGYLIPAGTTVLPFMYAVHRDPKIWKDPYTFNPERFLDEEGRINKDERLIPFSMGKRVCLGESLARMELFLFFASIMQQIKITLPSGHPVPTDKSIVGLTNGPYPMEVVMEVRNAEST